MFPIVLGPITATDKDGNNIEIFSIQHWIEAADGSYYAKAPRFADPSGAALIHLKYGEFESKNGVVFKTTAPASSFLTPEFITYELERNRDPLDPRTWKTINDSTP